MHYSNRHSLSHGCHRRGYADEKATVSQTAHRSYSARLVFGYQLSIISNVGELNFWTCCIFRFLVHPAVGCAQPRSRSRGLPKPAGMGYLQAPRCVKNFCSGKLPGIYQQCRRSRGRVHPRQSALEGKSRVRIHGTDPVVEIVTHMRLIPGWDMPSSFQVYKGA